MHTTGTTTRAGMIHIEYDVVKEHRDFEDF